MKKKRTALAALALAAGVAAGTAPISAQASGWELQEGEWAWTDESGTPVNGTWRKGTDGWYYLGEDGRMARNRVVESPYGGYFYYVDEEGRMAQDSWKYLGKEASESGQLEEGWYYFGSDGKNYRRKGSGFLKEIGGKTYILDEKGRMQTGWVDGDGNPVEGSDAFVSGVYYAGEDGALLKSSWLDYYLDAEEGGQGSNLSSEATGRDYTEYDEMWFYFDGNGKKVRGTTERLKELEIGGNEYGFDENGVMLLWWSPVATDSDLEENRPPRSESSSKFYSEYDGGRLLKDKWVWMYPAENLDADDYNNGEYSWWRTDEKGKVYRDKILEVNGNTYAFDGIGRMQTGFVLFEGRSRFVAQYDVDGWSSEDFIEGKLYGMDKSDLYLFSPDELNDGSMQRGSQIEVELEDGVYTFGFSEKTGKAYGNRNRMKKEGDRWYINGLRLEGKEEYGYGVVGVKQNIAPETDPSTVEPEYYQVVDENGRVVEGKNRVVKDREDGYLLILNNKYAGRVWDDGRKVVYKKVDGVEGFYYDDRSREAEERYELILSKESFDMEHPDMENLPEEERLNFS